MTERKFELRKVSDPPDGAGGIDPDREYWEVWVEDADGQMKRVGGDLDVVGVTDHAGANLASEAAENVALQLQDAIDAQHPWTTTWNNPEGRAEMLAAHKWDRDPSKRGEPLLVYVEGEAYIAWFDPDLSVSTDNPFDALLWLHGGPNPLGAVEDATQFQRDLRTKLVDPTDITPPHFIPAELQVKIALNKIKAKLAGVIAKIERNKGAKLYKFVGDVLSTWSETEGWQPVVTLSTLR